MAERFGLISPGYERLSIVGQCNLLGLQRSRYYFKPKGESLFNQTMMKVIDRKFLNCPFYGVERMTSYLNKDLGYHVDILDDADPTKMRSKNSLI